MLKPVAVPLYQKGVVSSSDLTHGTHIYVTLLCLETCTPNSMPHVCLMYPSCLVVYKLCNSACRVLHSCASTPSSFLLSFTFGLVFKVSTIL